MSEQLTIACPHCAYSKSVPKSAIPDGVNQATCPKCKQSFSLNNDAWKVNAGPGAFSHGMAQPSLSSSAGADGAPPSEPAVAFSQSTCPPTPRTLAFSFNGSAQDYFGIWIVNTLLKILTIGIYSAWAKVRKRRFFFGSTTLHGQPFEYLADPMALFRGWLIAAGAFILYTIGTQFSPVLSMVIAVIVYIAFPWLVVRSKIFNAANSSHRNIRFGFRPAYKEAYWVFLGLPILTALSFGLLVPYMSYRQKKFMVENSSYGSTPFSFSATVKDFYILFLKVALGIIAIVGLFAVIAGMSGGNPFGAASTGGGAKALRGLTLIPFILLPLMYFVVVVYVQTAMANLSWNGTHIGDGRFHSTLRTRDMALLFITNAVAIMCTFGLMVPWATVRLVSYRFKHLKLETADGLENVVAAAGNVESVSATGEELGDIFDMPIDIAM